MASEAALRKVEAECDKLNEVLEALTEAVSTQTAAKRAFPARFRFSLAYTHPLPHPLFLATESSPAVCAKGVNVQCYVLLDALRLSVIPALSRVPRLLGGGDGCAFTWRCQVAGVPSVGSQAYVPAQLCTFVCCKIDMCQECRSCCMGTPRR